MDLFVVDRAFYSREDGRNTASLRALSAFNRINALSCIKSAEHGWLGASYSLAELLTVLYFRMKEYNVVLSKGHAAAMQYACLYGRGTLSREDLLSYKNGPGAPQAHAERSTPGVLLNSGSLGQALSKTAGMAVGRSCERFFVILGDGELQEGQVFEGLLTVAQRGLSNVTVIVDQNGFQTEREVARIKAIADLPGLFAALGFEVLAVDGHDPLALADALEAKGARPKALIARTEKAGGSKYLRPEGGRQPWHGKVPDDALYLLIVAEQVTRAGIPELVREFEAYTKNCGPDGRRCSDGARPVPRSGILSTRDAFSRKLEELLSTRPEMAVLDADLAHSCGLDQIEGRSEQFFEMGISEQDMVSFAAGLALSGRLPVVNTYAAFFKRAFDQLYSNQGEGVKILYAGHYAGLCYFTDGKTHQSINDLAWARALPGLLIIEPVTPSQAEQALAWAAGPQPHSVYFRLRRTPVDLDLAEGPFYPDRPIIAGKDFIRCFFTTGTVSTRLAVDCQRTEGFRGFGLVVQSVFGHPPDLGYYRGLLADTEEILTIEEDLVPGTLNTFVRNLVSDLGLKVKVQGKAIDRPGHSFRSLKACLDYFEFTPEGIRRLISV